MKPKFTDAHRFPNGEYVPANKTDVSKTFKRIRERLAKNEAEARLKVKLIQTARSK